MANDKEEIKTFSVKDEDAKKRLDVFLAEVLKDEYSRSGIRHLIDDGFVLINNKKTKASYKLKAKDEIKVSPPPKKELTIEAEDIPLKIIYEDKDVIVIDKEINTVVHPALGNYSHTLVNALLFHCKEGLSDLGAPLRPGVVHRLDKDVSGVIVFAKNDTAYKGLVEQFKERTMKRKYIALVKGDVKLLHSKIDLPIGRSRRDRKKMAVTLAGKGAKNAITYYNVLDRFLEYTKLEINLATGRTHQIRVHMSYIGHPILGDTRYGGPKTLSNKRKIGRVMLHAASLGFKHPVKNTDLHFESPLPEEFNIK